MNEAHRKLLADGYCVIDGVLDADLIESMRTLSAGALSQISLEHRSRNRSQGSLMNIAEFPGYAELIGNAPARKVFEQLNFADPRFSGGYLINKPPSGPPLFWHQDWWGWDDPISYTDQIAQVFFMYYLTDTSPENGCLRVLPGSHRRRHRFHDVTQAHGEALSRVDDPDHPLYGSLEEEDSVAVRAGDLVVGDARLLHSAHANRSAEDRSLITLWYHPGLGLLPAGMRARIREIFERRGVDTDPGGKTALTLDHWPDSSKKLVSDLFPPPEPGVESHSWNRTPNWELASGSGEQAGSPSST
jgi:hypothetical protein